ncbi:GPCR, rhodopsin-like, 7TM domain-containing protein [Strongyloides ratti]|uniref:GPCR, rhodopsin-like, 7TM domain-containing protein n=1 Tax=Strongyloides ratti TaxID=34506 RepID=A0A090KU60_STRRB|nr:GPCR, rhodopsin-like, 7TM domain-containing protein [Strongyloides ratti]CEF60956.1 GPCR, rhodopsin-like, 7TM domain-containing protein [Strongyloides ratti]
MNDFNMKMERIGVGTLYLILNLLSIFVNILSITTFFYKKKYFSKIPFYKFYYHLSFANSCINFTQLSVVIPFTYSNNLEDYENSILYRIFCEFDTFGYNLSVMLLLSLSLDRFLVFAFPKTFFSDKISRINKFILISWLISIIITIGHKFDSVYKLYNGIEYALYYKINNLNNINISLIISDIISKATPIIILLSYIFCFIRLKYSCNIQKSGSRNKWKYEKQILLQGLTISLFYELESILFLERSLIITFFNLKNVKIFNIIVNCVVVLYTCYISASLFFFNNVARQHFLNILKNLKVINSSRIIHPINTVQF